MSGKKTFSPCRSWTAWFHYITDSGGVQVWDVFFCGQCEWRRFACSVCGIYASIWHSLAPLTRFYVEPYKFLGLYWFRRLERLLWACRWIVARAGIKKAPLLGLFVGRFKKHEPKNGGHVSMVARMGMGRKCGSNGQCEGFVNGNVGYDCFR